MISFSHTTTCLYGQVIITWQLNFDHGLKVASKAGRQDKKLQYSWMVNKHTYAIVTETDSCQSKTQF